MKFNNLQCDRTLTWVNCHARNNFSTLLHYDVYVHRWITLQEQTPSLHMNISRIWYMDSCVGAVYGTYEAIRYKVQTLLTILQLQDSGTCRVSNLAAILYFLFYLWQKTSMFELAFYYTPCPNQLLYSFSFFYDEKISMFWLALIIYSLRAIVFVLLEIFTFVTVHLIFAFNFKLKCINF